MSAGALDPTFGNGGLVLTPVNSGWLHNAVAIEQVSNNADVVVAGMTHNSSGMADIALARYLPNGTLDSTFGTGGLVTTQVGKSGGYNAGAGADAVAIQGDGKIVVAGSSYSLASGKYPYDSAFMLARYNVDGTLDTTFGNRGVVVTDIYASNGDEAFKALAIQSNGEIVAAGFAGASFTVARYTATGSLDSTFNGGGVVENRFISSGGSGANAVTVQSDGKIVAAGQSNNEFAVARYNTDGALDTGFNSTGYVVTALGGNGYANTANGVVIQPLDGKIDVAGYVGGA